MPQMRALVDDLHAHGQRYVMITDPGISSTQPRGTYRPLDEGIEDDVFINVSGKPLVGKVWPGELSFWSSPALAFAFFGWMFFMRFFVPAFVNDPKGLVHYPDFFKQSTMKWWQNQISSFHDELDFDGMW
jgi:lysosomal alpha-glucosidase